MNWVGRQLDSTWKRVAAAVLLSGVIILAVNAFAESSFVQTQKVQQESAQGQHCQQWKYETVDGGTRVTCTKWPRRDG